MRSNWVRLDAFDDDVQLISMPARVALNLTVILLHGALEVVVLVLQVLDLKQRVYLLQD